MREGFMLEGYGGLKIGDGGSNGLVDGLIGGILPIKDDISGDGGTEIISRDDYG
uniref:Uncharacterized protein n=1 Tax=Caulobacter phage BL57 TaxID=3348355 RepID=A0AB74UIA1_9VIRU